MSLNARGKLAGTLVYSAWKGRKICRHYVVPSNPNSSGQQTQRDKFGKAVNRWHDIDTTAIDAWDLFNQHTSDQMTAFNQHVKSVIAGLLASDDIAIAKTLEIISGTYTANMILAKDGEDADDSLNLELHYGTSPNVLSDQEDFSHVASNQYEASPSTESGVTYYGRVYDTDNSMYVSGTLKWEAE